MSKTIEGHDQYLVEFVPSIRKEALKYALDIRKFEIELYWRRAAYFWALLAAAFAAYFALYKGGNAESYLVFLVACVGTLLSSGWYLVNRGSKYWQENWERHVDALEEEVTGPLYRTTILGAQYKWINLWSAYPYSVSKVNHMISLYVAVLWVGLAIKSFPGYTLPSQLTENGSYILGAITLIFLMLLFFCAKSRPLANTRDVRFQIAELD